MRYNEIISEGRDYPLYHFMDLNKAREVFAADVMEARWIHEIPGIGRIKGNSFTRNKHLDLHRPFRIKVDHKILSQRHRIIPVDGERIYQFTQRYMYDDPSIKSPNGAKLMDRGDRQINNRRTDKNQYTLQEEFVIGDIKNLHTFITSINISRSGSLIYSEVKEVIEMSEEYCGKYGIPLIYSDSMQHFIDNIEKYEAMYDDDEDEEF